jgi:hypothetical protein
MHSSSTSLPQLHGQSPSSALPKTSKAPNKREGSASGGSIIPTTLPLISGSAQQSSADVPTFFHGHSHSQAVATGKLDDSEKSSATLRLWQNTSLKAVGAKPDAAQSDGDSGLGHTNTRLRLFVKGVLPCFNPTIMEAYGAGVREMGIASVDPDVIISSSNVSYSDFINRDLTP